MTDHSGVIDIARNGIDEAIKLKRQVDDIALLAIRLVRRMRAAREGKGSAAGDAEMAKQVICYLKRHGLSSVLREVGGDG